MVKVPLLFSEAHNHLRGSTYAISPKDGCYDRGSTFRLNCFLNDGAPQPKNVGKKINNRPFLLHDSRCVPGSFMGFFHPVRCSFIYLQKSVFGRGLKLPN